MRVELRDGITPDEAMPAWPVDTLGNAAVPRVGDDVATDDAWWLVESVVWQVDTDGLLAVVNLRRVPS